MKREIIDTLINNPVEYAKKLGFTDLGEMHNTWIRAMVAGNGDATLQAHRGSYKTTCVSVALSIIIILFPKDRTLFMRKTDSDIKEVIRQVTKILNSSITRGIVKLLYGEELRLTTATQSEISTNLNTDKRGMSQLMGLGLGGSITGKHFDRIFTDDIVNIKDRISRAEREQTKLVYQELQNVKNRGGRIFNTGTPWHKDDCFTLMPNIERYSIYETGMVNEETIIKLKQTMTASLFAANYELKHIADDDVIFVSPHTKAEPCNAEQGIAHIDASYGGADYTAFTICSKKNGKYYVFGKLWHCRVDEVQDEIIKYSNLYKCSKIWCEDNGDKGYLAKELKRKGEKAVTYHESMNKYLKIITYLKSVWEDVEFVAGTDEAYIEQVCDYNENAEHDDAPDSLACCIRKLYNKSGEEYTPLYMHY